MGQCFGKISQNNIIPEHTYNKYDVEQIVSLSSPNITKRRVAKVDKKG